MVHVGELEGLCKGGRGGQPLPRPLCLAWLIPACLLTSMWPRPTCRCEFLPFCAPDAPAFGVSHSPGLTQLIQIPHLTLQAALVKRGQRLPSLCLCTAQPSTPRPRIPPSSSWPPGTYDVLLQVLKADPGVLLLLQGGGLQGVPHLRVDLQTQGLSAPRAPATRGHPAPGPGLPPPSWTAPAHHRPGAAASARSTPACRTHRGHRRAALLSAAGRSDGSPSAPTQGLCVGATPSSAGTWAVGRGMPIRRM